MPGIISQPHARSQISRAIAIGVGRQPHPTALVMLTIRGPSGKGPPSSTTNRGPLRKRSGAEEPMARTGRKQLRRDAPGRAPRPLTTRLIPTFNRTGIIYCTGRLPPNPLNQIQQCSDSRNLEYPAPGQAGAMLRGAGRPRPIRPTRPRGALSGEIFQGGAHPETIDDNSVTKHNQPTETS